MSVFDQHLQRAEIHCQAKGERLTQKRKTVLLALLETQKAVSAYELVDYCKQSLNVVIPAMTVYRALDFLVSQGLVHRLDSANKYIACSHIICENHQHSSQFLICDKCQHVEEVNIDDIAMDSLQTAIDRSGFQLSSPQLEISGICNRCASDAC